MTSSFALLLHGGMHGAWCWERVIPHLRHRTIAIDLPGRPGAGKQPPTLDGFAEAVGDAIKDEPGDAVIVAHSLAGIVALAAAERAPGKIRKIIFVSAVVPPSGSCFWDMLPAPLQWFGRFFLSGDRTSIMPRWMARAVFCSDLSHEDQARLLDRLVPEPVKILDTELHYKIPENIGVSYVLTTRDRAIRPRTQKEYMNSLPKRTRHFTIDSGHSAWYSRPTDLAEIINAEIEGDDSSIPPGFMRR
ncbi:MAG: alpha/beta hydrolase [Propionibacterium sp.]|jgi:hydrolase, alpha/beta fold family protein, putative|nr:alpha/beta hydrolase [Propionibacterium sp.]MBB1577354.1 alpha/beta hydrolase [Propionibacterium sp.]